jgi:hypothetical protein
MPEQDHRFEEVLSREERARAKVVAQQLQIGGTDAEEALRNARRVDAATPFVPTARGEEAERWVLGSYARSATHSV